MTENKDEKTVYVVFSDNNTYPEVFEHKIDALEYANSKNNVIGPKKYMVIDKVIR